jgi:ribosomal-protein-alanine N-acetyltransferase
MDLGGLTIGEYGEEDLEEILEIERDSFPTPWSPGLFRGEKGNPISRMLVARSRQARRNRVAGYIVFWRVADEIHLHNVAVRRDMRRRGIASCLLSKAIRESRPEGATLITLEVRHSNLPAQRLYEKLGLSITGVRRAYYDDTGEDALIMSADLEGVRLEETLLQKSTG